MTRLIASALGLCLCAPAMAADWGETPGRFVRDGDDRCVWIGALRAAYPVWVVSPDPYYYFIPQYFPVLTLACPREEGRVVRRRRL